MSETGQALDKHVPREDKSQFSQRCKEKAGFSRKSPAPNPPQTFVGASLCVSASPPDLGSRPILGPRGGGGAGAGGGAWREGLAGVQGRFFRINGPGGGWPGNSRGSCVNFSHQLVYVCERACVHVYAHACARTRVGVRAHV